MLNMSAVEPTKLTLNTKIPPDARRDPEGEG